MTVLFIYLFTWLLRRARAASLKAIGSKFGALAEEEYDKIAPVIACTLPALTDSIPERKRKERARRRGDERTTGSGERSLDCHKDMGTEQRQIQGTGGRAKKNIGWIRRMFTAWRVSHAERREEREAAGETTMRRTTHQW